MLSFKEKIKRKNIAPGVTIYTDEDFSVNEKKQDLALTKEQQELIQKVDSVNILSEKELEKELADYFSRNEKAKRKAKREARIKEVKVTVDESGTFLLALIAIVSLLALGISVHQISKGLVKNQPEQEIVQEVIVEQEGNNIGN